MSEKRIFLFDEKDEDILYRAFAHYIARSAKKSINIIIAMLHMCVQEAAEKSGVRGADATDINPAQKREFLGKGIEDYLKRTELSYIHLAEINKGCMIIYDKWMSLRTSARGGREIGLAELLGEHDADVLGYDDQEVLLNAFSRYVVRIPGIDVTGVQELIRSCILDVTRRHSINLRDARNLDEATRGRMITEGITEFIKRARLPRDRAELVMKDCLMVYERWKEICREDPGREEYLASDFHGQ